MRGKKRECTWRELAKSCKVFFGEENTSSRRITAKHGRRAHTKRWANDEVDRVVREFFQGDFCFFHGSSGDFFEWGGPGCSPLSRLE